MAIQTICKGVCQIHSEYKICIGCLRTRLEIAKWVNASDEEKRVIIKSTEVKRSVYGELNG